MPKLLRFRNTKIAFSNKSNAQLKKSYWLFYFIKFPSLINVGTAIINFLLRIHFPISFILKHTIFEQFCGGENLKECDKSIKELQSMKVGTILDYSVEGVKSKDDFIKTTKEIINTINKAKNDGNIPFCVFKFTGIGSSDLLQKVQKGILTKEEESEYTELLERVDLICKNAFEANISIFVDAEETWIQDVIDDVVASMMEKYNKKKAIVYNTIQFYRKDALDKLNTSYKKAVEKNYFYGVKMVRGAYMDKEREIALENNYPSPIHTSKRNTDKCYNEGLRFCIENYNKISLCAGTHNEKSCLVLAELIKEHQLENNHPTVFFAQLYGMSDHISFNLSAKNYNVAKYVPYGPVRLVMPYLFRRAKENNAITGKTGRELLLIQLELKRRRL